jgi:hypothetical protein
LAVVPIFEDDREAYLPSASAEFGNKVFDKEAREAVRVHFLRGAINRVQTETTHIGRITKEITLFERRVSRLRSFLGCQSHLQKVLYISQWTCARNPLSSNHHLYG